MKVTLIAHTPEPQRLIETCARISYQTQNDPFDPAVNAGFILRLIGNGHESPLEHASATLLIEDVSRACSHQIVRHRLASYTQRSSRYTQATGYVALPASLERSDHRTLVKETLAGIAKLYENLVEHGVPKEDARFILPQAESTSLYMTANLREWRHFLKLRLDRHAQWEIRAVAREVLRLLSGIAPDCFRDLCAIYPALPGRKGDGK